MKWQELGEKAKHKLSENKNRLSEYAHELFFQNDEIVASDPVSGPADLSFIENFVTLYFSFLISERMMIAQVDFETASQDVFDSFYRGTPAENDKMLSTALEHYLDIQQTKYGHNPLSCPALH